LLTWLLLADRLTIPETPRYTFDIARDVEQAGDDVVAYVTGKREGHPDEIARITANKAAKETLQVPKASFKDFLAHYGKLKNFLVLFGTAGSWFCLDVAFYGLSLNNATILGVIGYSTKNTASVYEYLYNTAVGNVIIVLAGAVPGYWVSVATIDTLGRKTIQFGGFAILTILFIVMGFAYNNIGSNGLLAIYVIAQFFFNFGK
jgi:PHS family inorganic phosphate transporter-like MFS transporter